jgi:hypothetical protein
MKANLFAVRKDGITFIECLEMCIDNRSLLKQFDRLNGTNLSLKGLPIEIEIDKASGRLDDDFLKFVEFVWEYIFTRVPVAD